MAWARGNRRRATGEGQQAPTDVMLFDNESSVVNDPFGRERAILSKGLKTTDLPGPDCRSHAGTFVSMRTENSMC